MPSRSEAARRALLTAAALLVLAASPARGTTRAPDIHLTDQNGRPFVLSEHFGAPIVLFFGYTYCPDICPTTLATLARAKNNLGAAAAGLTVVFVTVDPQRDTPPVLKRYIAAFDPSFVALTGTLAQLTPVYAAYHVTRQRDEGGGASYGVSHTALVYFIGSDGALRSYGEWSDSVASFERSIRELR